MSKRERKPPSAPLELIPPSTGDEAQLIPPAVPDAIIDEVFEGLRGIHRDALVVAAVSAGKLLVDKFFGGDIQAWRDRGDGDASLRVLADRFTKAGVRGFSASNLSRFVAFYEIDKRLGVSDRKHLNVTHVRAVIGLPGEVQEKLLNTAVEKEWTGERLEKEVSKHRKSDGRGRPVLPMFVKTINKLDRIVKDGGELFGGLEDVEKLEADEATRLYQAVTGMKLKCEELQQALGARAKGTGSI